MLIESIAKHIHLSENDKHQILDHFETSDFKNGEILLYEGNYAKHLYFVNQGYIRSFYTRENGSEKTHWIYNEHDFFTSWYSFFTGKASFETLQVINQASLYLISIDNYKKLYANNEAFNAFINAYYQHFIAEIDFLSKSFTNLSAKEKYRYLLETNPKMVQEVKLGFLASLLDISQETLSRVRRLK